MTKQEKEMAQRIAEAVNLLPRAGAVLRGLR